VCKCWKFRSGTPHASARKSVAKTPQIIINHAWGVILDAELLHPSPQVQVTQHPGLITSLLLCAQPPTGDSLCGGLCTPPHSEALAAHKPKGVRVRQGIRRRLFHAYGATTVCLTRSSAAPARCHYLHHCFNWLSLCPLSASIIGVAPVITWTAVCPSASLAACLLRKIIARVWKCLAGCCCLRGGARPAGRANYEPASPAVTVPCLPLRIYAPRTPRQTPVLEQDINPNSLPRLARACMPSVSVSLVGGTNWIPEVLGPKGRFNLWGRAHCALHACPTKNSRVQGTVSSPCILRTAVGSRHEVHWGTLPELCLTARDVHHWRLEGCLRRRQRWSQEEGRCQKYLAL